MIPNVFGSWAISIDGIHEVRTVSVCNCTPHHLAGTKLIETSAWLAEKPGVANRLLSSGPDLMQASVMPRGSHFLAQKNSSRRVQPIDSTGFSFGPSLSLNKLFNASVASLRATTDT